MENVERDLATHYVCTQRGEADGYLNEQSNKPTLLLLLVVWLLSQMDKVLNLILP